jgi:hypothetical protein
MRKTLRLRFAIENPPAPRAPPTVKAILGPIGGLRRGVLLAASPDFGTLAASAECAAAVLGRTTGSVDSYWVEARYEDARRRTVICDRTCRHGLVFSHPRYPFSVAELCSSIQTLAGTRS